MLPGVNATIIGISLAASSYYAAPSVVGKWKNADPALDKEFHFVYTFLPNGRVTERGRTENLDGHYKVHGRTVVTVMYSPISKKNYKFTLHLSKDGSKLEFEHPPMAKDWTYIRLSGRR